MTAEVQTLLKICDATFRGIGCPPLNLELIYHTRSSSLLMTLLLWASSVTMMRQQEEVNHVVFCCNDNNVINKTKEMIVDFRRTPINHTPLSISGSTTTTVLVYLLCHKVFHVVYLLLVVLFLICVICVVSVFAVYLARTLAPEKHIFLLPLKLDLIVISNCREVECVFMILWPPNIICEYSKLRTWVSNITISDCVVLTYQK